MRRALLFVALASVAIAAGVGAGEGICRATAARKLLAKIFLDAPSANEFVRQENLDAMARTQVVTGPEVGRELCLLSYQFADDKKVFKDAMTASSLNEPALMISLANNLGARAWIEKEIAPQLRIDAGEVKRFYDVNPAHFAQPKRYRVSHIFLAAPDGYPDEVIAAKRSAIQGLSVRILAGEKFADVVTEASEDEATKTNGGDLGYFSARRIPPEFIAELEKLRVGEISGPIRSHLGFHIVQVTEMKDPEQMSFDKVQSEIASIITNQKRAAAVAQLTERLTTQ